MMSRFATLLRRTTPLRGLNGVHASYSGGHACSDSIRPFGQGPTLHLCGRLKYIDFIPAELQFQKVYS